MTLSLPSSKQFLSVSEMLAHGLSYYKINRLAEEGKLKKLNNTFFENLSYDGEISDFARAAAYAPKGVICMMTAARYYDLTTFLPDAVDIAIERSMKISTLPDWPALHIWYFPKARYEQGLSVISDSTGEYRMYNMEKTVVDVLYYRNKVGIEETKEILTNYLARQNRDLLALHRYAEELGCGKILRTYLEVLL
jgi:predicted transcriptional regulator of viral defense system